MRFKFVSCFKRIREIQAIKSTVVFGRYSLRYTFYVIRYTFLRQDDDMLLHLELLKEKLAFDNLSYVLKSKQNIFFIFLVYKTLRAIVTLFFSNIFQSYYCNGNFVPSQLYLFIENLIFVILSKVFLFVHDLIWKY